MNPYYPIKLHHANLKIGDQPRPLHVVLGTVGGYYWSEPNAATLVFTSAGQFPVIETPDQIDEIIKNLTIPIK